jgi:hypothetical protein
MNREQQTLCGVDPVQLSKDEVVSREGFVSPEDLDLMFRSVR